MDSRTINQAAKGTSSGSNAAGGYEQVYLSSSITKGNIPQLAIWTERGVDLKGVWQI